MFQADIYWWIYLKYLHLDFSKAFMCSCWDWQTKELNKLMIYYLKMWVLLKVNLKIKNNFNNITREF